MNKIVDILMTRDGISELEAQNIYEQVSDELNEAIARGDYDECDEILRYELGLEPDYLFDFIY